MAGIVQASPQDLSGIELWYDVLIGNSFSLIIELGQGMDLVRLNATESSSYHKRSPVLFWRTLNCSDIVAKGLSNILEQYVW